jgi:Fe(3+) dicitrate transport protein
MRLPGSACSLLGALVVVVPFPALAQAEDRDEEPSATAPPSPPPPDDDDDPLSVAELTVIGTRKKQDTGSAHVLDGRDLERFDHDDAHQVLKNVPGVYTRGEDGFGLRPNIGIRGVSPDRSKKITLMEDGVLFGPAPYTAPAAYYFPIMTRMESVRVIKGPGAVSFGPQTVGGAVDLITRRVPTRLEGAADVAGGQHRYGKAHAHLGASSRRWGFLLEGVHLRTAGFKALDQEGDGDTGFARNEAMGKLRFVPAPGAPVHNELELKLGYADEDSRETYLGLADQDFRADPLRRYAASRLDHMQWRRTQAQLRHALDFGGGRSLETTAYRHDLDRTWNKVNRFAGAAISDVLQNPTGRNAIFLAILRGEQDNTLPEETLFIGPNRREFVSQGLQSVANLRWDGALWHRLELGARLHHDRIDRLHTEQGYLVRGGALEPDGSAPLTTADGRSSALALALHALDTITWNRFTFTPGLRFELIFTEAADRARDRVSEGAPQRVLIPGAGTSFALTPEIHALAGVYRGFSPAAAGQPAEVRPETSWNYEAGLRWSGTRGRADAVGFFNDYQNLTSVCTTAGSCSPENLDRQFNAGRARIYGAELFGQADLRPFAGITLPIGFAYTFTRTRLLESFVSDDPQLGRVTAGDELPYVPRHQATITLALETARFGLQGVATYASSAREQAGQGALVPDFSTDPSLVLELGGRLYLHPRAHVYLHVRNLLDAHDIASRRPYGARPISPRWVQAGLKATF